MRKFLLLILLVSMTANSLISETEAERDARMAWWREARFGMFVHWGLYAGLAGTWDGQPIGTRGGMEWAQKRVGVDTYTYAAAAIPKFIPKPGFAQEWARLAKAAGCKYVVFTTKHHDGFALHDSRVTDYDAGDVVGRDLVREIVDALRAEGLRVGFYHSVIDWHHPQYDFVKAGDLPYPDGGRAIAVNERDHAEYVDYLHAQVRELVTNYGPVDVLWWDYSKPGAEGEFWRADELVAMVKRANPAVIMNNRLYRIPHIEKEDAIDRLLTFNRAHGDFTTPEQTVPSRGVPGVDWEQCMTMNTTWGYSEHDHAWKSDETLIRHLVDIASKGGNYLLNVGPMADGSIPAESVESMQAIGNWLKTNGESIYGTSANPFEELSFEGRCTTKANALYLHVYERPLAGRIEIKTDAAKATLLDGQVDLPVNREGENLVIQVPDTLPDEIVTVVKVH